MTNMIYKVCARIFFLFIIINVETSFALDLKRDVGNKHLDEILSWNPDLNVIKTYELETTKKIHDIFFRLTESLTSNTDLGNLKKYRKARFGLWGKDLIKSKFRGRGQTEPHWRKHNKSIKIRFKDSGGNTKKINFNSLHSDPYLLDMIAYKLYQATGLLAPNMEFSQLIINGEYNGIKQRLENINEDFLERLKIPLGNIYKEKRKTSLDSFYNWVPSNWEMLWQKETLKKENNYEDWVSFLEINSIESDDIFFRYIEKYLDIDYYLKWHALTNVIAGTGNHGHNFIFVNDFRSQKFKQIGYDTIPFGKPLTTMPTYFYRDQLFARVITKPEYYFKVIKYMHDFLQDSFKERFFEIAEEHLDVLSKTIEDRRKVIFNPVKNSYLQSEISKKEYFFDNMLKDKYNHSALGDFKKELFAWYESRKKYLLKEFGEVAVNLNHKNLELPANQNVLAQSGESELPVSITELITKGGSGVKLVKLRFESSLNLEHLGVNAIRLCYDQNSNRQKDVGETCIFHAGQVKGNFIYFENKNNILPLLLPKLDFTENPNASSKVSTKSTRRLAWKAQRHNYLLLFSFYEKANIDVSNLKIKVKSVKLKNALTGLKILINEGPIFLKPKDYEMRPGQKIAIKPLFSDFMEGIESAKIEWSGLPSWLALDHETNLISGVVPRIPPVQTKLTLKLYVNDVVYQYKLNLYIKEWSKYANYYSYIDAEWASFVEREDLRFGPRSRLRRAAKKWFYKLDSLFHVFFDFESIFNKRGIRIDQSWLSYDVLEKNKSIIWGPGTVNLNKTVVLPGSSKLTIKPGTLVNISPGKAIIFHGIVSAIGEPKKKIVFTSSKRGKTFGSLIFNQWSMPGSNFKDVIIENGKDFFWKERFYSGALSAYNTPINLYNVTFRNNSGDDAFNAKYSNSIVESSTFYDNAADAIDLDFSGGVIRNNILVANGNDGIDVGTSISIIEGNWIEKSGDKGISIGEEAKPIINNNIFYLNRIGVAIKDGSSPTITNSLFLSNKTALSMYIKKKKYKKPYASLINGLFISNKNNLDLLDSTSLDFRTSHINEGAAIAPGLPIQNIYSIFSKVNSSINKEKILNNNEIKKIFKRREGFRKLNADYNLNILN
jgi:parallel beta-helix repeat protein